MIDINLIRENPTLVKRKYEEEIPRNQSGISR